MKTSLSACRCATFSRAFSDFMFELCIDEKALQSHTKVTNSGRSVGVLQHNFLAFDQPEVPTAHQVDRLQQRPTAVETQLRQSRTP